jgi:hypothetical protein
MTIWKRLAASTTSLFSGVWRCAWLNALRSVENILRGNVLLLRDRLIVINRLIDYIYTTLDYKEV